VRKRKKIKERGRRGGKEIDHGKFRLFGEVPWARRVQTGKVSSSEIYQIKEMSDTGNGEKQLSRKIHSGESKEELDALKGLNQPRVPQFY